MNRKDYINISAVFILVIVFATFFMSGGYKKKDGSVPKTENVMINKDTLIDTATLTPISNEETKNWKTYQNKKYGIEFKYPPDVQVMEEKLKAIMSYAYNAIEVDLKKIGQDINIPFITLGIANDASIAANKPPTCGDGEFCVFTPFKPLICEQYYKDKQPGIYNGASNWDQFFYIVLTVANKKACSENTRRGFGESVSNREVVFYGPDNTRFQFRAFLGYGLDRDIVWKATDSELKKLEQDKAIYPGSYDAVQLMNKIIATVKITE